MPEPVTDLVVREEVSIVRAASDVGVAFEEYQRLQRQLDKAMPDCIVTIAGNQYRTKRYWMAIATAFGVDTELIGEPRKEILENDWGYIVHAKAMAPNGRTMDAMGACFASEKGRGQDSVHNVLAHAETRARVRAISNLVGFGEVGSDEMGPSGGRTSYPKPRPAAKPTKSEAPEKFYGEKVNFGQKFKNHTWGQMVEGALEGDRHGYLIWIVGNVDSKESPHKAEVVRRAQVCLDYMEEQRKPKRNDAADEPPDDYVPPEFPDESVSAEDF